VDAPSRPDPIQPRPFPVQIGESGVIGAGIAQGVHGRAVADRMPT